MNMRKLVVIIYSLVLLFAGCDDLEDKPYTTGEANGGSRRLWNGRNVYLE